MALRIDGKATSQLIKEELKLEVEQMKKEGLEVPTLAVVLVGDNAASKVYVNHKKKGCAFVGIRSLSYELGTDTTEEELLSVVDELNNRKDVHGILVQLPLPKHIDEEKVLLRIDPHKDVDGFHPFNVGSLSIGRDTFRSCTPAGIIELLRRYDLDIEGKHCVIVGRSNIVGKPLGMMLLAENGTVTICHSRTKDLKGMCKSADILIAAIGRSKMIDAEYVKNGAVVIDVGINRLDNGKLCGDVDFESVEPIASAITPVPGGVGPMTIAMLLKNCTESAKKHQR